MNAKKGISFILVGMLVLALIAQLLLSFGTDSFSSTTPSDTNPTVPTPAVQQTEQGYIDQWIAQNNLNAYGDPADTVYSGGTPLFNEATGEVIDRYSYIVSKHPDRPWLK